MVINRATGSQTTVLFSLRWRTFRTALLATGVSVLIGLLSPARAASPDDPATVSAVDRAVVYLQKGMNGYDHGSRSLALLAILKSGVRTDAPVVKESIEAILEPLRKAPAGEGAFSQYSHSIYVSAVDLMCLIAADPKSYEKEIRALIGYVLSKQRETGNWGYYESAPTNGDSSQTQMALLALWMANHAGYKIPPQAYERAAHWFLTTQTADGGFKYHPSSTEAEPTPSMTVAGATGLAIARMHVFRPTGPRAKFGILERVDHRTERGAGQSAAGANGQPPGPVAFRPSIHVKKYNWAMFGAVSWIKGHFSLLKEPRFQHGHTAYYLYGLERCGTLLNIRYFDVHDWYDEGTQFFLSRQKADGSWSVDGQTQNDTSFAILFLVRSTLRTLEAGLAGGMMRSGKGLPGDLSNVSIGRNGRARRSNKTDPLNELLSSLADPKGADPTVLQHAIVDKARYGDREELIGQKDLLAELCKDQRAEVRQVAVWALGRCEDVSLAPLLISALEDDDLDVAVEARNALCHLARRPLGFGLSSDPRTSSKARSNKAKRAAAIKKWRYSAAKKWIAWFERARPYDENDDLLLNHLRGDATSKPARSRPRRRPEPKPELELKTVIESDPEPKAGE